MGASREARLDALVICLAIGVVACALVVAIHLYSRRKFQPPAGDYERLLDAIIDRQSPAIRQRRRTTSGSGPLNAGRRGRGSPQVSMLEGHLRSAIIDAGARERLVANAMPTTGGDRAAAIRKVLRDLADEDKRLA